MNRRRLVRVPASSANLGPGYDCLAAALSLHLELEVEETGEFSVETDLDVPLDHSNLCVQAFEKLHPTDGLAFRIRSEIPLASGLGSSAAAIVAGLVAADSIFELGADVLAHAIRLEGHPDNVAPALLGGFVLCADGHAERFEPPAGLECLLVVPRQAVRTAKAREALPSRIPVSDAVFNIGHASLLVLGLATGDLGLVSRGLGDRIHQPRRAHLYPRSWELVQNARQLGALGATISGAGPTVLVWCDFQSSGAVMGRLHEVADGWADVLRVPFTPAGAQVSF
jgi:homoserine kinase